MKILAAILSIYFIGLSFVPCADGEDSHANENKMTSIHMELGDQHGAGMDSCTPFCSCHCCQVQVSGFYSMDFSVIKPDFHSLQITYRHNRKQAFSAIIIQPPIS